MRFLCTVGKVASGHLTTTGTSMATANVLLVAWVAAAMAVSTPTSATPMPFLDPMSSTPMSYLNPWTRSLSQTSGSSCCLLPPAFVCGNTSVPATCPAGATYNATLQDLNCKFINGNPIVSAPADVYPPGCSVKEPFERNPTITVICGEHNNVQTAVVCIYGAIIGPGINPQDCKTCVNVTIAANCDISKPGAKPGSDASNTGAGRDNITCPNDFKVVCRTAGQIVDLNAIGCTATNKVTIYPGPFFFWNQIIQDQPYIFANKTNSLPTTLTCTQQMVDGLGCQYSISGMPPNGCLNKAGSSTYIKIGGPTASYPAGAAANPVGCPPYPPIK